MRVTLATRGGGKGKGECKNNAVNSAWLAIGEGEEEVGSLVLIVDWKNWWEEGGT